MKKVLTVCALAAMLYSPGVLLRAMGTASANPRRVEVTAKRFAFNPDEITLKKGEPVVLVLKSADVAHGIRIRELGVEVKAPKGETAEIRFTPDKAGTFVGHCYVFCGEGHGTMTITLHVVE